MPLSASECLCFPLSLCQAMRFAATFEEEAALSVDLSSRPFKITTNNSVILAQSIVIATGADSRWLGASSRLYLAECL